MSSASSFLCLGAHIHLLAHWEFFGDVSLQNMCRVLQNSLQLFISRYNLRVCWSKYYMKKPTSPCQTDFLRYFFFLFIHRWVVKTLNMIGSALDIEVHFHNGRHFFEFIYLKSTVRSILNKLLKAIPPSTTSCTFSLERK